MKTYYYCERCNIHFYEEKIPNINRVHYECGSSARVVKFSSEAESPEGQK